MDEKTIARFWAKVDKNGPVPSHMPHLGRCWVWKGTANSGWYGHFSVDKKRQYAHRLSWEMHNAPIPNGLIICHRCDNASCVRPEHMFLGTHADNANDKSAKGRAKWKAGHQLRLHPEKILRGPALSARHRRNGIIRNLGPVRRGSQCGQAKLTETDIIKICELRRSGVGPQRIADQFSVSRSLIQQILRGDQWKHVARPLPTPDPSAASQYPNR